MLHALSAASRGRGPRRSLRPLPAFLAGVGAVIGFAHPAAGNPLPALPASTVDRYGDPLPPGAVARMGTVRLNHEHRVLSLALSPDGRTLASGSFDPFAHLWDAATGREIARLPGHETSVDEIVFSADGRRIATVSGASWLDFAGRRGQGVAVRVWDVESRRELRRIAIDKCSIHRVAWSGDGRRLAATFYVSGDPTAPGGKPSGGIRVWNPETGAEVLALEVPGTTPFSIAISPDGSSLAAGCHDDTVRLWSLPDGRPGRVLDMHESTPSCVAFSPDGRLLASEAGDILLWDVAGGSLLREIRPDRVFSGLAFTSDGRQLISGGPSLAVWDVATGREIRSFADSAGEFAVSADGRLAVTGQENGRVRVWDAVAGREVLPTPGHLGGAYAVAFTPDGRALATGGYDDRVRFWDAADGREIACWNPDWGFARLEAAPDGRRLAAICGRISFVDPATGRAEKLKLRDDQGGDFLALAPDGRSLVVTLDSGKKARVVDVPDGRVRFDVPDVPCAAAAFALSPDGRVLAGAWSDSNYKQNEIALWDVASGRTLVRVGGRPIGLRQLLFSPDGRVLAGTWDKKVVLFAVMTDGEGSPTELAELKEFAVTPGEGLWPSALGFSPDGRWLLARVGDRRCQAWETATGGEVFAGPWGEAECKAFAWAGDGHRVATVHAEGTALVWDLTALAAASNGGRAVPANSDDTALWEELGSEDAARGLAAAGALVAAGREETRGSPPGVVATLCNRLRAPAPVPAEADRWIADLDHDDEAVRERATRALGQAREAVEPALRRAIASTASAEARTRMELLLRPIDRPFSLPPGGLLRTLRAVMALEWIAQSEGEGNPAGAEARRAIEDVVSGTTSLRVRREAQAALDRLTRLRVALAVPLSIAAAVPDEKEGSARPDPDGDRKGDRTPRLVPPGPPDKVSRVPAAGPVAGGIPEPEARNPRLDTHGDPLPDGALARFGTVRLRQPGGVYALAFTPDGRSLVSGGEDGGIRVWEVPSGRLRRMLRPLGDGRFGEGFWASAASLCVLPDGATLASGDIGGGFQLWDLSSGVERFHATWTYDHFLALAGSPDGRFLISGEGGCSGEWKSMHEYGCARLWDLKERKAVAVLDGRGMVSAVAVSSDGALAAFAGGDSIVRLWDLHTRRKLCKLRGHQGRVHSVAFARDGKSLYSTGEDGTVRRWDVAGRRDAGIVVKREGMQYVLAISPDGQRLAVAGGTDTRYGGEGAVSTDGSILIWDLASGRERFRAAGHACGTRALAFSPDGDLLASAGGDGAVRLWNMATGAALPGADEPAGGAEAVAVSPDGKAVLAGYGDGTLRVWEAHAGRLLRAWKAHDRGIRDVAWLAGGRIAASAAYGPSLKLWDASTGAELASLPVCEKKDCSWSNAPDIAAAPGRSALAVSCCYTDAAVWEVAAVAPAAGPLPEGAIVCRLGDGSVVHARELKRIAGTGGMGLALSPDGRSLLAGDQKGSKLYDVGSGAARAQWPQDVAGFAAVISPDGRWVASAVASGEVVLIDGETKRERFRVQADVAGVMALAFSPDGRTLATAWRNGIIWFWRTDTGTGYRKLDAGGRVTSLSFAPDGGTMVTSLSDSTVLLWKVEPPR